MKHTAQTFINALSALALALAFLASANSFAGEYQHHLSEGQPVVVARGNARAVGRLGFRYENGFGVPQNYAAAADLYRRAAEQGDAFAQSRLGLFYDKGHGVPLDLVLSYKWLNIAAARAARREYDFYSRLRDAVGSKMSLDQVIEAQKLALIWTANWEAERR